MQRVLEPELMDDPAQALAYAQVDFSEPHTMFVDTFKESFRDTAGKVTVLDLGCGSADVTIRFAIAYPECVIDAVDGAQRMLEQGLRALDRAGLGGRIRLLYGYIPALNLPRKSYDIIISNSLLHHLKDPASLWQTIRKFGRVGTCVLVMDLRRPLNPAAAWALVNIHAAGEPAILKRDFYNSLCAAYEADEVRKQLEKAGLGYFNMEVISDRHVIVYGRLV
ncbi:MAG: class I SAM-dependent methyltransferase [Gammaproteobacteria bacterium]